MDESFHQLLKIHPIRDWKVPIDQDDQDGPINSSCGCLGFECKRVHVCVGAHVCAHIQWVVLREDIQMLYAEGEEAVHLQGEIVSSERMKAQVK